MQYTLCFCGQGTLKVKRIQKQSQLYSVIQIWYKLIKELSLYPAEFQNNGLTKLYKRPVAIYLILPKISVQTLLTFFLLLSVHINIFSCFSSPLTSPLFLSKPLILSHRSSVINVLSGFFLSLLSCQVLFPLNSTKFKLPISHLVITILPFLLLLALLDLSPEQDEGKVSIHWVIEGERLHTPIPFTLYHQGWGVFPVLWRQ